MQKSLQYRDQQLAYCTQREQQCDQRLLYVSTYREPQPLATPDGLQPLPGGWHNHEGLLLYFTFSVATQKRARKLALF